MIPYLLVLLIAQSLNFILMKRFMMRTKLNLLAIVFFMYLFGGTMSTTFFVIDAAINDQ